MPTNALDQPQSPREMRALDGIRNRRRLARDTYRVLLVNVLIALASCSSHLTTDQCALTEQEIGVLNDQIRKSSDIYYPSLHRDCAKFRNITTAAREDACLIVETRIEAEGCPHTDGGNIAVLFNRKTLAPIRLIANGE
jgi:hypothetical protein